MEISQIIYLCAEIPKADEVGPSKIVIISQRGELAREQGLYYGYGHSKNISACES